jgi:outer membrane protein OmpA-like peptidoglycan-associated protein
MKTLTHIAALLPLTALACASTGPSAELLDARRAYDQARMAPDARYAPDRVLEAKQALDRAESAHKDDPGSFNEKSLAYIATRRSELAVLYGDYEADRRTREQAEATYRTQADQLRHQAENRAEEANRQLQGTQQTLGSLRQQLEQARGDAAAAMASLEQVAKVKEESRGTVITLDGSVLFVSGKAELLPIARRKLDEVAKVLNDTNSDQQISVEGYTDSQGSDDFNQRLSQDRADAVRSYLVQQGVPSQRITAVGKGEASPIASNDTAEGRANNRRVEIVLGREAHSGGSSNAGAGTTQSSRTGTTGSGAMQQVGSPQGTQSTTPAGSGR